MDQGRGNNNGGTGRGRGGGRGGRGGRGGGRGRGGNRRGGRGGGHQGNNFQQQQQQQQQQQGQGYSQGSVGRSGPAQDRFAVQRPQSSLPAHESRTSSTTMSQMTNVPFDSLQISPLLKQGIRERLKYPTMTKVQHESIPHSSTGADLVCRAKTGTGKTLSFLIPAVNNMIKLNEAKNPRHIKVLAISPTRELASQIADEGRQLLAFTNFRIVVVYGGTPIKKDISKFNQGFPEIIVATPGRLLDHLQNTNGFADALRQGLNTLVFDEADQLLDMGFRPDITRILSYLPPATDRQTLLFSATMPEDLKSIVRVALQPQYHYIDCVGEDDHTHQHVPQEFTVVPMEVQIPELVAIVAQAMRDPGYKIVIFFTTARLTQFYAELFVGMGFPQVLEIHSRKSQPHRKKVSDRFRNGTDMILFTSDVSARGMDYPDVSHVIQVGLPADRAQYVHRLGRTARAGKQGRGVLLLCDFGEQSFLNQVRDLPMEERPSTGAAISDSVEGRLSTALANLPPKTIGQAYQAWMGFYNSNLKRCRIDKPRLVQLANQWVTSVVRAQEIPQLEAKTVGKMGLKGVPGLNVAGRDMQGRKIRQQPPGGNGGGYGAQGGQDYDGGRGGRNGGRGGYRGRPY